MEQIFLSSNELSEGITMELITSIKKSGKSSPVLLAHVPAPVNLLNCSLGYNAIQENEVFLKNEKGKLLVITPREALMARARYLLLFGQKEKQQQVEDLVQKWKDQIREELNKLKIRVEELIHLTEDKGNLYQTLARASAESNNQTWEDIRQQFITELNKVQPMYERMLVMYDQKKFVELLSMFNIKTFSNPMLVYKLGDEKILKVLKNTFGREAIEKWDGNMINRYAMIDVEKEYSI